LGYFKDVDIDTQEVPSTQDQVDLNVNVVEKPTGMLTLGAGFSSAEKVTFSFGIQQDNVFGSGQNLGLQVSTSKFNQYLTSQKMACRVRLSFITVQASPTSSRVVTTGW
jgi:outer membrane protein insertion porin family